jgi:hypothetical protein
MMLFTGIESGPPMFVALTSINIAGQGFFGGVTSLLDRLIQVACWI